MKRFLPALLTPVFLSGWLAQPATAMTEDDPLNHMVVLDQFEYRSGDGHDPVVIEAYGWLGYDLHKLWFDAEVERVNGETEESEWQLKYSRAVAPYWDLQVGMRRDFEPSPRRNWLVLGLSGLAPYYFEIDAQAFLGEAGRSALRLDAEYELMVTQRVALVPEIEMNVHGYNDEAHGIGSGLSDLQLGVRLRYEIRREFAPYLGYNWNKLYGNTADFARNEGEHSEDSRWVIGLRAWF